ncbi:MAG: hypothetical protein IH946_05285 [Bacteroidetes bacterium]|nr:hypothetical protein [Bacteroidota bacterium]
MKESIQGSLFKRSKRLKHRKALLKKDFEIAHHIFNNGRVEVTTLLRDLKRKMKKGEEMFYEVCLNLHGFDMHFSFQDREEALKQHTIFCDIYKNF